MILIDQIGAGLLYRGSRPTIEDLKQVDFDVNLEVGWFEFFHGIEGKERRLCIEAGTGYFHRPLSDFSRPSIHRVDSIISQLRYWLFKGKKVLVHCLHGNDRTGIVCAAYRIKYHKWTVEQAIDEMYERGYHVIPYEFPLSWESVLYSILPD